MQVVMDLGSFNRALDFAAMMELPKMIYGGLRDEDKFGLRWLSGTRSYWKKGFGDDMVNDIILMEEAKMNRRTKTKSLEDVTEEFISLAE